MKIQYLFVICISCVAFACTSDSLNRKILVEKSQFENVSANEYQRKFGSLLGLPDISKGYDSLCIRVWLWGYDTTTVISINLGVKQKDVEVITYHSETLKDSQWIVVINDNRYSKPLSGWDSVSFMIDKLKIRSQPSHSSDDFQSGLTGGSNFVFEIATHNSYRSYRSFEPSFYRTSSGQANDVYNFLVFLDRQFGKNIYRRSDTFVDNSKPPK